MEINVKDIRVERIDATSAIAFVRRNHYSGKVVNNSQLHFGAFHGGKLHGVLSFGPPMDKSRVLGLVEGTGWADMIELNRMAFDEVLPRNSESRVIAVCLRLLKKHCPHVRWVLSFSDGAQCGDGTIYRASGFVLTSIKINKSIYELPDGYRFAGPSLTGLGPNGGEKVRQEVFRRTGILVGANGSASLKSILDYGAKPIPGFQLRYIYLLDKTARLTVPVLPYSRIDEMGAGMYKGQNVPIAQRKPAPVLEPGAAPLNLQRIPAPEAQTDERLSSTQEVAGSIPSSALTLTPTPS